jgi:N-acylneuraminate cytidylyltransferase
MIAIIPARRGSKGIPGKNRRPIAGRPLVAWVIGASLDAEMIDETLVATDDPEVALIAERLGATVVGRSAESAADTAPTETVLTEILEARPRETEFALLQATSPLTTAGDVDAAVAQFRDGGFDSLVSVAPQTRFLWQEGPDGGRAINYEPANRPRRQECDPLLIENGAIYVFQAELLRRTGSRLGGRIGVFRMTPDTYHEVDEPSDWILLDGLIRKTQPSPDYGLTGIKLVISDVDGVLTDGGMYWSTDGTESKKFNARDGKGFELLRLAGIKTALLTSERLELVAARGSKLGCHHVGLDVKDKLVEADRLRRELALEWSEIAFIGDDLHDISLLERVGMSASPADAVPEVQQIVDRVLTCAGGAGCFREFADLIRNASAKTGSASS